MMVVVETLFYGFYNHLWLKKKNTTSITEVLRREEVNGRNCELLMETRRR
jgi:hypothetical protein